MAEAYNESDGKLEVPEYECKLTKILFEAIQNYNGND
jgi:hypothetical protein